MTVKIIGWGVDAWQSRAACRDANPVWFDRPREHDDMPVNDVILGLMRAASLCDACPVIQECRLTATKHGLFGVWGGVLFDYRHERRSREDLIRAAGNDPLYWRRRRNALARARKRYPSTKEAVG